MDGITFNVGAPQAANGAELRAVARRAEKLGYVALWAPDHPGAVASPFVLLAHAAAATTTLRLQTYVLNAGLREPLQLASDVATLDALSDGRFTLGLGAGHTPAEWEMRGHQRPSPADRIARMVDVVDATRHLLSGAVVSRSSAHLTLRDAQLGAPRPVQEPVPLLVGGANPRVVDFALEHADVVGLSGLGRTLADGHLHETRWGQDELDALARQLAHRRPDTTIDALVQFVKITDRREADAERFAGRWTTSTAREVLACPFVLLGTLDQIAAEMAVHRERFGINSYSVRAAALEAMAPLIGD